METSSRLDSHYGTMLCAAGNVLDANLSGLADTARTEELMDQAKLAIGLALRIRNSPRRRHDGTFVISPDHSGAEKVICRPGMHINILNVA